MDRFLTYTFNLRRAGQNLRVTAQEGCEITLAWNASTDDEDVDFCLVYEDGQFLSQVKAPTTTITEHLVPDSTVSFTVVAKDASFNESAPSNAVSASC